MLLFLNKKDVLIKKYEEQQIPLSRIRKAGAEPPDAEYDPDCQRALSWFAKLYINQAPRKRQGDIFPHVTTAVDTALMQTVFRISIVNGSFFGEGTEVNFTFDFNYAILEDLYINATISIHKAYIDFHPQEESSEHPILPPFEALGPHTIRMDEIDLNDILADVEVRVELNVTSPGGNQHNFLLAKYFKITLDETLQITVDWRGFVASVG